MDVSTWWKLLYVALGGGALLTLKSAFMQGLAVTGKVRSSASIAQRPGAALLQIEIKKSCWTWFYLLGSGFNSLVLLLVLFAQENPIAQSLLKALQSSPTGSHEELRVNHDTVVFLSLFAFHNTRRFAESLLITEFGNSTMHIGGFLLGCIHYLSVSVSILSDPDAITVHQETLLRRSVISIGTVLFVVASYHQSLCNFIIAKLKKQNHLQHVVPHGDWFNHVRCPLYTTEVLLYLAFVAVLGGGNAMSLFIFAWVLTNQCVSAKLNSDWYDHKFRGETKDNLPKWILLPGVW